MISIRFILAVVTFIALFSFAYSTKSNAQQVMDEAASAEMIRICVEHQNNSTSYCEVTHGLKHNP